MKKVVIIGGGFAGSTAARLLENEFDVTLVDTKNYYEFTPSILRTLVEPSHLKKIQVLHSHYLHRAKIVVEPVIDVTIAQVKTAKQQLPFDYLIISSGSSYKAPFKEGNALIATRAEHLREYHNQMVASTSILIIGGGLVGIELAAEIVCAYPDKKVTIVHAADRLIERNPPRASAYAEKFLLKRGVRVLYNERVKSNKNDTYETDKGTRITADMAFMCTGIVPNCEFLRPHLAKSLNERDHIIVNEYLQVAKQNSLFSCGDITSLSEEKTAQNAEKQAHIVAHNIRALEHDHAMLKYVASPRPMVISLGPKAGIFVYSGRCLTGRIPGILKRIVEWKALFAYR